MPHRWLTARAAQSPASTGTSLQAVDVIALGSQDNRVSVWRTDESRAVCVSTRFFTQTAIDLAWTPDGYTLLACSTDGRVGLFRFEEHELGQVGAPNI